MDALKPPEQPLPTHIEDTFVLGLSYDVSYIHHYDRIEIPKWNSIQAGAVELNDGFFYDAEKSQWITDIFLHAKASPKARFMLSAVENRLPLFGVDMYTVPDIIDKELYGQGKEIRECSAMVLCVAALASPVVLSRLEKTFSLPVSRRYFLRAAASVALGAGLMATLPSLVKKIALDMRGDKLPDANSLDRKIEALAQRAEEMFPSLSSSKFVLLSLRNAVMAYKLRSAGRIMKEKQKSNELLPGDVNIFYPVGAEHIGIEHMLALSDEELSSLIRSLARSSEVADEMKESIFNLPEIDPNGKVTMHTLGSLEL